MSGTIARIVAIVAAIATFLPLYRNVKKSTLVANLMTLLSLRIGKRMSGAITNTKENANKAIIML